MHFLLSGLIESGRKGELATAVEALSELNNGGDDAHLRSLYRRLALGGVIVARLLLEGVLEQDRRVRSQFRACLVPLLSSTDAPDYLQQIRPSHSRAWLCDVLVDTILEQSEAESIGAALLSAWLLHDEHPRVDEVKNFLCAASIGYQRCVIEDLAHKTRRTADIVLPQWLIEVVLRLLIRPNWLDLGVGGLAAAVNVLSGGQSLVARAARELSIAPSLVDKLEALLCSNLRRYRSPKEHTESRTADGIVDIIYMRPSADLQWRTWSDEIWTALAESDGILQAIYRVFCFVKTESDENARALLDSVGGDAAFLKALPEGISSYFADGAVGRWGPAQEFRAENLLCRHRPGCPRTLVLHHRDRKTQGDWAGLLNRFPLVAHHLLLDSENNGFREYVMTAEGAERLLDSIRRQPSDLLWSTQAWGELFALPTVGELLRSTLLEGAAGDVMDSVYARVSGEFELRLPEEAAFLPHVLGLLVGLATERRPFGNQDGGELSITERLSEGVRRFIPEPKMLVSIKDDNGHPKRIRAAATVLWMAHPGRGNVLPLPTGRELVSLYEPADGPWFVKSVAAALTDAVYQRDTRALATISAMIDSIRSDYPTRIALDSILEGWREMARAPVQKSPSELWK